MSPWIEIWIGGCPNCESEDISPRTKTKPSFSFEGDAIHIPFMCNRCESTWDGVFSMAGYTNLNQGTSSKRWIRAFSPGGVGAPHEFFD